jgi:hypothetical protein
MNRILTALTLSTILSTGCVVETGHHDPYSPVSYAALADLEINWTIGGEDSPALCDYYGISHWTVEVRGPEARDVGVDCRSSVWTTASDLHLISEGNYIVTLRAVGLGGETAMIRSTSVDVLANGYVTQIDFPLGHADFIW